MSLKYHVFLHSYPGFNSDSTLFYGEQDAILIDACHLLSDAHKMAAELLLMGKNLTHIYVSHFHPDHHFGLAVLQPAFPKAQIVALPSVVRDIVFTSTDKMELWDTPFGANIPTKVVFPMPLSEPRLELEGHELRFFDDYDGDSANNSVVWVPSLKLVCATDVAYLDVHMWTIESDADRRRKWRASIKKMLEFDPRVIVPGHVSEAKLNVEGTSCVDFCLTYLDRYEEVLAGAKSGLELWEGMQRHYPDMKAMDYALQWQCRLLFPKSCPDWFPPLPGEPGQIFLDPQGKYVGEPSRE
jgi:glyoxylase-like metal-dependent hydrolase (beta-lactamase superfamily II)